MKLTSKPCTVSPRRSSLLRDIKPKANKVSKSGLKLITVKVRGHWKRIYDEDNKTDSEITYYSQSGFSSKTSNSDETSTIARQQSMMGVSAGFRPMNFKASTEVSSGNDNTVKQLGVKDCQNTGEQRTTFKVQPGQRVVRWQFVADTANSEGDFQYSLTTADDKEPTQREIIASVSYKAEIQLDKTRIRIRHKGDGQYLTIVSRRFMKMFQKCEAATLGRSVESHFLLTENPGIKDIKLQICNDEDPKKTKYLSNRTNLFRGWVCCTRYEESKRLDWITSKAPPLYDGDAVTFRHGYRYLCLKRETKGETDVYCLPRREDEWILEVVD